MQIHDIRSAQIWISRSEQSHPRFMKEKEPVMKKLLVVAIALMLVGVVFADIMVPGPQPVAINQPQGKRLAPTRQAPAYTFSTLPTALVTNFYDYMIGSYNGLPLRVIPTSVGGGYFATYHAKLQPTSTRRVFYTYIDATGTVQSNNEITETQIHEGFASLAVDPVDGKPLYAWHANVDADSQTETLFTADAFMAGIPGLFLPPVIIADGPTTIASPSFPATTDNEFIWPTVVIGPSPTNGMRRVYICMRNFVTHSSAPSENPYIAWADFNGTMIEEGSPALVWNYVTIPAMDDWNADAINWRRPFMAIAADAAGNIYYAGYHYASADDVTIDENDLDVFKCDNYGQGTWTHAGRYSNLATWNPNTGPGDPTGYFTNEAGLPFADTDLSWNIANSSHLNAVFDNTGKLHIPALWALSNNEGKYYPNTQFVKEFIFDPATGQITVNEVYPQKDPSDTFNEWFTPWDMEAPWGEVDEYGGSAAAGYFPAIVTDWPFPLWDATASTDNMTFHYNNYKMTEANSDGLMAAVWQNSYRARLTNFYSDTDYTAWANVPEIYISVSQNNGNTWSEPIVLNNIETPALAGIKPMWVYPADKPITVGFADGHPIAKLGLMFYDDYTWGSFVQTPAYHPNNDGGRTMFMEIQIEYPVSADDPSSPQISRMLLQNYPNPFNPETTISFDLVAPGAALLNVYNVKGQLVRSLANSSFATGRHNVVWNGRDDRGNTVSSGVYFYRLSANGHAETRKMILIK